MEISTPSLISQLMACAVSQPPAPRKRFNPRPPGVIQRGSATDAVLAFLRESGRFHTMAQIMWKTGRSHSAVSWALIRLRAWGLVRTIGDTSRNSRYLRYAVKNTGEQS